MKYTINLWVKKNSRSFFFFFSSFSIFMCVSGLHSNVVVPSAGDQRKWSVTLRRLCYLCHLNMPRLSGGQMCHCHGKTANLIVLSQSRKVWKYSRELWKFDCVCMVVGSEESFRFEPFLDPGLHSTSPAGMVSDTFITSKHIRSI